MRVAWSDVLRRGGVEWDGMGCVVSSCILLFAARGVVVGVSEDGVGRCAVRRGGIEWDEVGCVVSLRILHSAAR